jgi:hypothetical protein
MTYVREVPSDDQVLDALRELEGRADALALCRKLMSDGHPELQSQLAIQRTAERGKILVDNDWTLTLPQNEAVPA